MELACTATTSTTSVSRGISDVGARAQATGTTLGADNGIGVAAALALLDQPAGAALPPLECLFTVDEETGLTGAFQLDASMLTGARPPPAALRLSAPRRARWPCLYAPGARRWHRQTQASPLHRRCSLWRGWRDAPCACSRTPAPHLQQCPMESCCLPAAEARGATPLVRARRAHDAQPGHRRARRLPAWLAARQPESRRARR